MLVRIRALLAKAESTPFPFEADAFTLKAYELMARHSIDRTMLAARDTRSDAPVTVRVAIDNPYVDAKSLLLQMVAQHCGTRAVRHPSYGFSSVVGFRADVIATEILFTSLLHQSDAELHAASNELTGARQWRYRHRVPADDDPPRCRRHLRRAARHRPRAAARVTAGGGRPRRRRAPRPARHDALTHPVASPIVRDSPAGRWTWGDARGRPELRRSVRSVSRLSERPGVRSPRAVPSRSCGRTGRASPAPAPRPRRTQPRPVRARRGGAGWP